MVYLDHNATTPIDPEVLDAMLPYLKEGWGNPSSLHAKGYEAKKIILSDLNEDALTSARQQFGVRTSLNNEEVAAKADILMLAVKPQVMQTVITGLAQQIKDRKPG